MAELSHEVSLAQREVDSINDIGNSFFDLTSLTGDQAEKDKNVCRFLLKSKKMYEAIEYILHKSDRVHYESIFSLYLMLNPNSCPTRLNRTKHSSKKP